MKTIHHGTVKQGKFQPEAHTAYLSALGCLEGKRITITVERFRKARSGRQNAYYWGVVIPMIQEAGGYAIKDEAHDACRWACLRVERDKGSFCKSTTVLSTVETEEYYSRLRQLASEGFFGDSVWIPEPNETEYNYTVGA